MQNSALPMLIVDHNGLVGSELAKKVSKALQVVYLTSSPIPSTEKLYCLSMKDKLPKLPSFTYGHIVLILDDEQKSEKLLRVLFRKAVKDSARFFIITALDEYSKDVEEFVVSHPGVELILMGDLFGKNAGSRVAQILHESRQNRLAIIPLQEHYPVFLPDAVEEIIGVMFRLPQKEIKLLFSHAVSEMSIARMLQKNQPLLSIDLLQQTPVIKNTPKGIVLLENYPLIKKLQEALKDQGYEKEIKKTKKKLRLKKRKPSYKKKILIMVVSLFLFPLVLLTLIFMFGLGSLMVTKTAIDNGDFQKANSFSFMSEVSFGVASSLSDLVSLEAGVFGQTERAQGLGALTRSYQTFAYAIEQSTEAARQISSVFHGTSGSPKESFISGLNSLHSGLDELQKLESENQVPAMLTQKITELSRLTTFMNNTQDVLPSALGFDKKQTYLLLFANNMELRPGGGFIGSYATVTLYQGKVEQLAIHDVYDADGQLKGHVEPPFALRRYLNSPHWYLRDSTFNADFLTSAKQAAFFLDAETGQQVDGVISVDLTFVQKLLRGIGPVYVPDYSQTVTADNLFLLTESHSEKNFFPGSTQKKDFLRSLFIALREKIIAQKHLPYVALAKAFEDSLEQKDVLFAFSDPGIQNVFSINDYSSSLWQDTSSDALSVFDYQGVSEANLGVNKANAFIKRTIASNVNINEDGSVVNTVTLSYKNDSKGWPGGDYKNYLRLITPFGSTLKSIAIDGKPQLVVSAVTDPAVYEAPGFTPPPGLEVETTSELGKTLFGFLLTVPQGGAKTVSVLYTLPSVAPVTSPSFTYSLSLFKQPGSSNDPLLLHIAFPSSFRLLTSSGFNADGQTGATAQLILSKDQVETITLTKK